MNIGYYPGCALHGSSNDYEQSLRACLGALGCPAPGSQGLDLLRRHRRALAQSQAGPGAARAQPGPGRARWLQANVRALPDVLDAVAESAKGGRRTNGCARKFREIVEADVRGDGRGSQPDPGVRDASGWIG